MPVKHVGQSLARDRQVFDEGDGRFITFEPIESRNHPTRQCPIQITIALANGIDRRKRAIRSRRQILANHRQPVVQVAEGFALNLDQQHRLGFSRQHVGKPIVGISGDLQQAAVHQIAGHQSLTQRLDTAPRRRIETVKEKQHDAAMGGNRFGPHRRIDHDPQRPLCPDHELSQVDVPGGRRRHHPADSRLATWAHWHGRRSAFEIGCEFQRFRAPNVRRFPRPVCDASSARATRRQWLRFASIRSCPVPNRCASSGCPKHSLPTRSPWS